VGNAPIRTEQLREVHWTLVSMRTFPRRVAS